MKKGDIVYWARIWVDQGYYELFELTVCTYIKGKTWFTATDEKTKQTYLFALSKFGEVVFHNRWEALEKLKEEELSATE